MSDPTPDTSGDNRVLTVMFKTGIVAAIFLAFLAPAISQIFCSTACEGGQCSVAEPVAVCDLDAGGCCGSRGGAENTPSCIDLSAPRFQAECQPCSCFGADEIGCFVLSRHHASGDTQAASVADSYVPQAARQITEWASVMPAHSPRAHDPPIYRLTHALLI